MADNVVCEACICLDVNSLAAGIVEHLEDFPCLSPQLLAIKFEMRDFHGYASLASYFDCYSDGAIKDRVVLASDMAGVNPTVLFGYLG